MAVVVLFTRLFLLLLVITLDIGPPINILVYIRSKGLTKQSYIYMYILPRSKTCSRSLFHCGLLLQPAPIPMYGSTVRSTCK